VFSSVWSTCEFDERIFFAALFAACESLVPEELEVLDELDVSEEFSPSLKLTLALSVCESLGSEISESLLMPLFQLPAIALDSSDFIFTDEVRACPGGKVLSDSLDVEILPDIVIPLKVA